MFASRRRFAGTLLISVLSLLSGIVLTQSAVGQLTIQGTPLLFDDATQTGYQWAGYDVLHTPGNYSFLGTLFENGNDRGGRAIRWDIESGGVTILDPLDLDPDGNGTASIGGFNSGGDLVGTSTVYDNGVSLGIRAVLWRSDSTSPIELQNLGTDSSGVTGFGSNSARFITESGNFIAGKSGKYDAAGNYQGFRAVRWDANGNVTELGTLGIRPANNLNGPSVQGILEDGTVLGGAEKFDASGFNLGTRPVLWRPDGTIQELELLVPDGEVGSNGSAEQMNSSGVIVGKVNRDANNLGLGLDSVRWDANGNIALLGNLGTDSDGRYGDFVEDLNESGEMFGTIQKFDQDGNYLNLRAVRWDPQTLDAIEMETDTNADGIGLSRGYEANEQNLLVGSMFVFGESTGIFDTRAMAWMADGSRVNLNDLDLVHGDPGEWTLTFAIGLSEDGWVTGQGMYDPDGAGQMSAVGRGWVGQLGFGGSWTSAEGGTWGRGPNWSTGTPAMEMGNATFDLASSYTVSLDRDETTMSIDVFDGAVNIQGNGFQLATTTGDFTIGSNGTVTGEFDFFGTLVNEGTLSAGDTASNLLLANTGNINVDGDLQNLGEIIFDISGQLAGEFDTIDVSGEFDAGGILSLVLDGYAPVLGDQFDLMDFGTFVDSGFLFDLSQAQLAGGLRWDTSGFGLNGTISVTAVPEPSSVLLIAMSGLLLPRRRRF